MARFEQDESGSRQGFKPWKVLVVDDEPEIHSITRMVLQDMVFDGKGLELINAVSAKEAMNIVRETKEIAVVLLDVVLESDSAGLEVIKFIREELTDKSMRIILRTGHPGKAPEQEVFEHYEINDYQLKTDLTSIKLSTCVLAALRNYRDLLAKDITLRENEELLKEVHHRVKNNLQIITSLLSLQEKYIRDPLDRELFKESRNRIRSMALAHEKIYQEKNFSRIDLKGYFEKIGSQLLASYPKSEGRIHLRMDISSAAVSLNQVIPCGLVLNELLTNSIRHAFPQERTGFIRILFYQENGKNILDFSDDGIGLPEGSGLDSFEALGLKLVSNLLLQLSAELTLKNDPGAHFLIEFPIV